jgi:acetolactate synthase-1/2/3 large subunit
LYYPKRASGELSKDIRYDEMFKWVGCHTEFVTKPDEIRPALERSFGSGKPSLVNVIGETTETSAFRARYNLIDVWTRQNFDELPNEAQEEIRAWGRSTFERISKHARDSYGFDIPAEELAQMAGVEPDDE